MLQTPLNRSRSDKFILVLDIPLALKKNYDRIISDNFKIDPLQLSIIGSPVPAINVPAVDVPFGGQFYKTSSFSRPAYDPLQIKFLIDNGYKNYWAIWNWLNLLNNYKTSKTTAHNIVDNGEKLINPMSNYTSNFKIYGIDEYNNKIISFSYSNAFPISLSEINFNNQDPSEINSNVTFVFNQLEVELLKDVNQASC